jgi:hypothetical protein
VTCAIIRLRCISAPAQPNRWPSHRTLIGDGFEEIDAARGFSEHTTDRHSGGFWPWLVDAHPVDRQTHDPLPLLFAIDDREVARHLSSGSQRLDVSPGSARARGGTRLGPLLAAQIQYQETREQARLEAELASLQERNESLSAQVERLKTPEGVEEVARESLGMVKPGENLYVVIDLPTRPRRLRPVSLKRQRCRTRSGGTCWTSSSA